MGWCQVDQLVCADPGNNNNGQPCVYVPGGANAAPSLPTMGG